MKTNEIISVENVQLVKITYRKGNGTKENPTRVVSQFWNQKNEMMFEIDPNS